MLIARVLPEMVNLVLDAVHSIHLQRASAMLIARVLPEMVKLLLDAVDSIHLQRA